MYNDEQVIWIRHNDKLMLLRPQPQELHLILPIRQPQLPVSLPRVASSLQKGTGKTYLGIYIAH